MAVNRYERRRQAIDNAIREQIEEYKSIYKQADDDDREPTDEERLEIESHLRAIDTLKEEKAGVEANIKTLQSVDDTLRGLGPAVPPLDSVGGGNDGVYFENGVSVGQGPIDRVVANARKSIGEQFVESKSYQNAVNRWKTGDAPRLATGAVEIKAGTLTEAATLGAGLIPVPQVVPGMVQTLFQRLTIENLLDSGQATTNSIRYTIEGTATSGAAGVAEAGAKPLSALGLNTKDEPVKKIATTLVVTDEMMEDVAQVQSYVNGRLSIFVQNQVEASLLAGAGTNDLVGLLNAGRSINTVAKAAADNNADAIFKAMNGQRGSAQLEPDFVVMNPTNWQAARLLRDQAGGTIGAYLGGGPFAGPYGVGQMADLSNQVTPTNDYLWGKPVIVTSAIGAGTALIGTRAGAQVWSRGGLNVEASNSGYLGGVDLFTNNLVQIRAERRLALAVYRPTAFTAVTSLA